MCKRLKLRPTLLESEMLSLFRIISNYKINGNYMIIDIGAKNTKVHCIYQGPSVDTTIIDFGTEQLDSLYKSLYNCDSITAKKRRQLKGVNAPNCEEVVQKYIEEKLINPFFSVIDDIQNAYGDMSCINDFYAVGGGWDVPGLEDYFVKVLAMYLSKMSNLDDMVFYDESIRQGIENSVSTYSSCLSLALRGGI